MTQHKHLKQLVRARMEKTGERYAAARRHVLGAQAQDLTSAARGPSFHFPGNIATTTALRVVLTAAGARDPRTGKPLSEATTFGLAGGIGIGVFSFFYEKGKFASFFIAGRHLWHDFEAYFAEACTRLGARTVVKESSGAAAGAKMLRELVAGGRPCIAWVEMGLLPHRAMPDAHLGGGYHVVTVYEVDEKTETALIGDLGDDPVPVPLAALAAARARVKQYKHRLLGVSDMGKTPPLDELVRDSLRSCHDGLRGEGSVKGSKGNFMLDVLQTLATRIAAKDGKDSWVYVFAPGQQLWNGLTMMYDFIETAGTGGGLCRPMFAEYLSSAAEAMRDARLAKLSEQYADLGRQWTELAQAALPDDVPALRDARTLLDRRAEILGTGGETALEERAAVTARLAELSTQCAERFPLSDAQYTGLRGRLHDRVASLYEGEKAAHAAIGDWLAH